MAEFNAAFWEVPASSEYLENLPSTRGLWFETEEERDQRHALRDFFDTVQPTVTKLIDTELTPRQREVVRLYYFHNKTQEDIASILDLSQSTVSRHLFGTVRAGKKVGGAVRKLRKVIEKSQLRDIDQALGTLQTRLAQTA